MKLIHKMEEIYLKFIVIGGVGVGKTSIVRRYVSGVFTENYKTTIGIDFAQKITKDENKIYKINLYDISGQERFGNMTRIYYKATDVVLVVYDLTKNSSLEEAIRWKNDFDSKNNDNCPVYLIGNKLDQLHYPNDDLVMKTVNDHNFTKHFYVSAKNGENIGEIFKYMIKNITPKNEPVPETVSLIMNEKKDFCCW